MRTTVNWIAIACVVLGAAGALLHAGTPQAASLPKAGTAKPAALTVSEAGSSATGGKVSICAAAASFEGDAGGREVAGAIRDGFACGVRPAS